MWLDDLRRNVESYVGKGTTLVVAVSGGGDSMALLHGLYQWRERLNLRLVVAHVDHALRPDSRDDAAFVGQTALALGLLCIRERIEVATWAAAEGRNVEDAARHLRYTFLEATAQAVGASAIVVAHTQDDQAETVLMHLLRGAGLEGLTGMAVLGASSIHSAKTPLLRPLLQAERDPLRAWLTQQGYAWRDDATNDDLQRTRNHLRHRYIPLLEEISPRVRHHLARTATLLAADADFLRHHTDSAWQQLADITHTHVRFEPEAFLAQPHALQRRLIRRAYESVNSTGRDLSARQIDAVLALVAHGIVNQQVTLPQGVQATLAHNGLWIGAPLSVAHWQAAELPDSGKAVVGQWCITLTPRTTAELPADWSLVPATTAYFDADALTFPLTLRPPHRDDRWLPFGTATPPVSLHDWLSKQKVPHYQRESLPLLVDGAGTIIWVVGWRSAQQGRITPHSNRILQVTAIPI